jgi:hypothetical protein
MGGGISATLLMEFFSSPSDFSACWSLLQMRSQSCHCQLLPHGQREERGPTSRGSVTVPPWMWTMPFEKSCPFWPSPMPMLIRFAGGCDSLGGW